MIERTSEEALQALWIDIQFFGRPNIICGIIYRKHNSPQGFQICIATDHKSHEGHDVELLDKVADGEKVNILERAEKLKEKTKPYSDAIFKLEQTELELHTNITNAEHEVSEIAEQIIAKIRESEREIITHLENTRETRLEMLNLAKTQVQSLLK